VNDNYCNRIDPYFTDFTPCVPQDKNAVIENYSPHYTNKRFKDAQIVFGEKVRVDACEYSDRLTQWDRKGSQKASEEADKLYTRCTGAWVEKYLSEYNKKPVELKFVMAGFNWSNGYPYQVFGYNYKKE
jgi:hypothetical protein